MCACTRGTLHVWNCLLKCDPFFLCPMYLAPFKNKTRAALKMTHDGKLVYSSTPKQGVTLYPIFSILHICTCSWAIWFVNGRQRLQRQCNFITTMAQLDQYDGATWSLRRCNFITMTMQLDHYNNAIWSLRQCNLNATTVRLHHYDRATWSLRQCNFISTTMQFDHYDSATSSLRHCNLITTTMQLHHYDNAIDHYDSATSSLRQCNFITTTMQLHHYDGATSSQLHACLCACSRRVSQPYLWAMSQRCQVCGLAEAAGAGDYGHWQAARGAGVCVCVCVCVCVFMFVGLHPSKYVFCSGSLQQLLLFA